MPLQYGSSVGNYSKGQISWQPSRPHILYTYTKAVRTSLEKHDLIVLKKTDEAGNKLGKLNDLLDFICQSLGSLRPQLHIRLPITRQQQRYQLNDLLNFVGQSLGSLRPQLHVRLPITRQQWYPAAASIFSWSGGPNSSAKEFQGHIVRMLDETRRS